jgi:probable HAF family extracellular repeat protein
MKTGHASNIAVRRRANRLNTSTALALFTLGGCLFSAGLAQAAQYEWVLLPAMNGGTDAWVQPAAVSPDGTIVVGYAKDGNSADYYRAFRWSQTSGMTNLGVLPGRNSSFANALSEDGSVIVGYSYDGQYSTAFRWTEAGGIQSLGSMNGGNSSYANGVSADGTVVVGYANDSTSDLSAFRWTEASNTMVSLGKLSGAWSSYAQDVSADGKVVTGWSSYMDQTDQAFIWTEDSGTMVGLGTLNGGDKSRGMAISDDGNVVVGFSTDGLEANAQRAFRYSVDNSTMIGLGTLAGGNRSQAYGVNADGSVIVGRSEYGSGSLFRAFRWTADDNMISVEDWLRNNGVTIATDFTREASGVSADGTVIVGTTQANTGFIARLAAEGSGGGSGIIDMEEFAGSLAAKPTTIVGLNFANTILHGAHGEPMRNLLDVGKQSIWVTNDTGYDSGAVSDGAFGLVDFGYGLGLEGGATARFAFGGVYSDQDLDAGGNFINKGFYVAPEISLPVLDGLYATIGGYYAPGKLSVTRGYLNGGVMDYSHGEADLDTWAAKLRLDWLNAATISDWNLTPYASLTYARSKLDAYTETGGGFPASFNEMRDHSTVVRAGIDGVHTLDNNIRLLARGEAAYRFEDETAATSGTIIGLSGFSFAGQDTNQFWLRGGLGAEVDVAGGTASLNVNVTTQGDDPTVWVRSGWKVTF